MSWFRMPWSNPTDPTFPQGGFINAGGLLRGYQNAYGPGQFEGAWEDEHGYLRKLWEWVKKNLGILTWVEFLRWFENMKWAAEFGI